MNVPNVWSYRYECIARCGRFVVKPGDRDVLY